ncbi:hypothetical protein CVS40_8180 [Lucilia cuprina]|nr:hypothetical protein CVS40_8180 [Lucilia cuprina]
MNNIKLEEISNIPSNVIIYMLEKQLVYWKKMIHNHLSETFKRGKHMGKEGQKMSRSLWTPEEEEGLLEKRISRRMMIDEDTRELFEFDEELDKQFINTDISEDAEEIRAEVEQEMRIQNIDITSSAPRIKVCGVFEEKGLENNPRTSKDLLRLKRSTNRRQESFIAELD